MELSDSVREIKGIGEKTSQLFAKLGVCTVGELIGHYPRTYEVYGNPVLIDSLKEGQIAAVEASIATMVEVKRKIGRAHV